MPCFLARPIQRGQLSWRAPAGRHSPQAVGRRRCKEDDVTGIPGAGVLIARNLSDDLNCPGRDVHPLQRARWLIKVSNITAVGRPERLLYRDTADRYRLGATQGLSGWRIQAANP